MVKELKGLKILKYLRYLFFLHCPDCGGEMRSDAICNGRTVYVCTKCHMRWI